MEQAERREYLIRALLAERPDGGSFAVPTDEAEQKRLLRALFNIRPPRAASEEFLEVQDEYLQKAIAEKGVTDYRDLTPLEAGLYLWRGDITSLRCGGIVNAANSALLGCFMPNHMCIDNAIHTFAGVQLRLACDELMRAQGHAEPTGQAQITPAFNLPCRYVLHTVGPIVSGSLRESHCRLLEGCYRSCLTLAAEKGLESLAFCCISTGEFHFPNERAAEIAVKTVKSFRAETGSDIHVIFNVFKELDYDLYRAILG